MAKMSQTLSQFVATGKTSQNTGLIEFEGFNSLGDSGSGLKFYKTGATGVASQLPADLDSSSTFTDSDGYEYELVNGSTIYYDGSNDWFGGSFGSLGVGLYVYDSSVGWYVVLSEGDSAITTLSTTSYLINTFDGSALETGDVVRTLGYYTAGDGGGAEWVKTGNTDTSNQSPSDMLNSTLTCNSGYVFSLVGKATVDKLGIELDKTAPVIIADMIENDVQFKNPDVIKTTSHVASKWAAGEKCPIVFYGDSTTDGRVSTTDGTNEITTYNISRLVDGDVPDGLTYDHDDSEAPYCYVSVLQRMARSFYDNDDLRCYNAGYRGMQIQNGWATENVYNAVYGNSSYSDCEMIAINFGINDSEYGGSESLRENTYNYTKALIIDAYARGVQPFLVTTNAFTGLSDTGANYGENYEVVSIIDQVKRDLAHEMRLEIIGMGEFMYDFIYRNNEAYSTVTLIPDDIHGNDTIHLKQAEYLFYKNFSGGLVIDAEDGLSVDAMHPASRFPLSNEWFVDLSYGAQIPRRSLSITSSFVSAGVLDGYKYYNLWVWCDKPNMLVSYVGFTAYENLPKNATYLPILSVLSNQDSAENQSKIIYEDNLPSFSAGNVSLGSLGNLPGDYIVGRMRYGINRIVVSFPDGFEDDFSSWVGDDIKVGYFSFREDKVSTQRAVRFRDDALSFGDGNPYVNCLNAPIYHSAYDMGTSTDTGSNAYNIIPPALLPNLQNCYSLNKVGDSVDMAFTWDADSYCGYVLSALLSNSYNGFESDYDISYASCFFIYTDGTNVKVALVDSTYRSAVTMSALESDVSGKNIVVSLSLDTIDSVTLSLSDNTGTLIDSVTLDDVTSRMVLSGRAGGVYVNYDNAPTGQVNLASFKMRINH